MNLWNSHIFELQRLKDEDVSDGGSYEHYWVLRISESETWKTFSPVWESFPWTLWYRWVMMIIIGF